MFKILLISLFCFAAHAEEIDQMQNIYQLLSSKKEVKGTYRQEKNLKKIIPYFGVFGAVRSAKR